MNAILDIRQHALKVPGVVAVIQQCEQRIANFGFDRIGVGLSTKAVFKDVMGPFASYRRRLRPHPPRRDADDDDDGGRSHRRQVLPVANWVGRKCESDAPVY